MNGQPKVWGTSFTSFVGVDYRMNGFWWIFFFSSHFKPWKFFLTISSAVNNLTFTVFVNKPKKILNSIEHNIHRWFSECSSYPQFSCLMRIHVKLSVWWMLDFRIRIIPGWRNKIIPLKAHLSNLLVWSVLYLTQ